MEALSVGMYVRTLNGIVEIDKIKDSIMIDTKGKTHFGDFIKASYNIIDLIEAGDYVNGWRVNRVEKEEEGTILTCGTITSFVGKSEKDPYLTQDYNEADKMCKLKSIVTKEQFEEMSYKIKE